MRLATMLAAMIIASERVGLRAGSRQRPRKETCCQRASSKDDGAAARKDRRQGRNSRREGGDARGEDDGESTERTPRRRKRRLRGSQVRPRLPTDGGDTDDSDDAVSVKNPKLEARLLTLLPAGTQCPGRRAGIQELGPVRRRGARLEQPEYSVRRSEDGDDRRDAGHVRAGDDADVARAGDSIAQGARRRRDGNLADEDQTK